MNFKELRQAQLCVEELEKLNVASLNCSALRSDTLRITASGTVQFDVGRYELADWIAELQTKRAKRLKELGVEA